MEKKIKDLSLLLMFLTGWEEDSKRDPGEKVYRTWKGYLFKVLNELEDENMIQQFRNIQSVILTTEGKEKGENLKNQFAIK